MRVDPSKNASSRGPGLPTRGHPGPFGRGLCLLGAVRSRPPALRTPFPRVVWLERTGTALSQLARAHLKAVEPAPTGVSLAHDSPRVPPSWYAATRAIVVE